jgi:hypothetical protein
LKKEGMMEFIEDTELVKGLRSELDELRVHVDRLRDALEDMLERTGHAICTSALASTPAQSLADRDARMKAMGALEWLDDNKGRLALLDYQGIVSEIIELRRKAESK